MKRKVAISSVAKEPIPAKEISGVYQRIREILESARAGVARTVNTTQVVANWLIGREIVQGEQAGERRAEYGKRLIAELSGKLTTNFGSGYSAQNLFYMKQFYGSYPILIAPDILHAVRGESDACEKIPETLRRKSGSTEILHALRGELHKSESVKAWEPGRLNPNLSWTHYRTLLRVDSSAARAFYEIEAIKNTWSARELERQINSLLFERLAKSRDKTGLMKLATKGQEIAMPADVFKDPVVIEFLGLPESVKGG